MEAGYLGVGNMGQPMAHKLLDAGHGLTIYDINEAAMGSLLDCPARRAVSPKTWPIAARLWLSHAGEDAADVLDVFIAGLGMPRSLGASGIGPGSFASIADGATSTPWVSRAIEGPAQVLEILELAA
jgi:hypothetical protein